MPKAHRIAWPETQAPQGQLQCTLDTSVPCLLVVIRFGLRFAACMLCGYAATLVVAGAHWYSTSLSDLWVNNPFAEYGNDVTLLWIFVVAAFHIPISMMLICFAHCPRRPAKPSTRFGKCLLCCGVAIDVCTCLVVLIFITLLFLTPLTPHLEETASLSSEGFPHVLAYFGPPGINNSLVTTSAGAVAFSNPSNYPRFAHLDQGGWFDSQGNLSNPETGTYPAVLLLSDQDYRTDDIDQLARRILLREACFNCTQKALGVTFTLGSLCSGVLSPN